MVLAQTLVVVVLVVAVDRPVWLGASPYLLDPLAKALPEFYSLTTAGTPNTCQYEAMCGPQVRRKC